MKTRSPIPDLILVVLGNGSWAQTAAIHERINQRGIDVSTNAVQQYLSKLEDDYEIERRESGSGQAAEWRLMPE